MSQKCSVCLHPQAELINQQILNKVPLRKISDRFGPSKSSLIRHKQGGHISDAIIKGKNIEEMITGDNLGAFLVDMAESLYKAKQETEKEKDWRQMIAAIKELRETRRYGDEIAGKFKEKAVFNQVIQIVSAEVLVFLQENHPIVRKEVLAHLARKYDASRN